MSKIISLTGGTPSSAGREPQPAIVEALESLLDDAKAGNWPQLVFGAGRTWYDGPIWSLRCGVFSIDLATD
jgi:hypothetical protein